jgi:hypothetical protein
MSSLSKKTKVLVFEITKSGFVLFGRVPLNELYCTVRLQGQTFAIHDVVRQLLNRPISASVVRSVVGQMPEPDCQGQRLVRKLEFLCRQTTQTNQTNPTKCWMYF